MKIGLRGGHSPNCKGAWGYLDEQAEVRNIYWELKPLLEAQGHTVVDCNSDAYNVNSELNEGTNIANANGCDMYVTIHMNASGGAGHGAEVWVYDDSVYTEASNVCYYLAELGLTNRGVKYSTGLHDLNASAMPAMIVETLFCDNVDDTAIYNSYGASGIARAIAKAFGDVVENPTTGWQKNSAGWWYKYEDGSYPTNQWLQLDAWYYFDENGYAATGWKYINEKWYYFSSDCRMVTGWKWINDKCYFFNNSGAMVANSYIKSASHDNYYHWVDSSGAWDESSDSWDVKQYNYIG